MKTNKLFPLLVITIIVVVIAVLTTRQQTPTTAPERTVLFPDFKDSLNDVTEIAIQQGQRTLTLVNENDTWQIREAGGYPAQFSKIRQAVIAVSELEVISEKTGNQEFYTNLGVEDPLLGDAKSSLLTLKDASGNQLVALIVGKDRLSSAAADSRGLYVRLPDQGQALLVKGDLDAGITVADWIEQDLLDIDADRISRIAIARGDEIITLQRDGGGNDLTLDAVPEGKQARTDYVMGRMESILEDIRIDNVMSESMIAFPGDTIVTTINTTDGLIATATSAVIDTKNYIKFAFEYSVPPQSEAAATPSAESTAGVDQADEQTATTDLEGETAETAETAVTETDAPKRDVAGEAASLAAKTSGWVYQIPAYKHDTFTRKLDDLVEDIPEEEPAEEESED